MIEVRDKRFRWIDAILLLSFFSIAGCDEPSLDIRFDIPEKYADEVRNISLRLYTPPKAALFSCDDLAFQQVEAELLQGSLSQEVNIEAGGRIALAGIDRTAYKVFLATGFDADGATLVVGCSEVREVEGETQVVIDGQPATILTVDKSETNHSAESGSPIPARITLGATDYFSAPISTAEVRWTAVGPRGEINTGTGVGDEAGWVVVEPVPPERPGPQLLEIVSRWQTGQAFVFRGFMLPKKLTFSLSKSESYWIRHQAGHIGPNGEFGTAMFIGEGDVVLCEDNLDGCLAACDPNEDGCVSSCQSDWQLCIYETWRPRSLDYRVVADDLESLTVNQIDIRFDATAGEPPVLAIIPGGARDRLIAVSKDSWYELDAKNKDLIKRSYTPPTELDNYPPNRVLAVPPCSGDSAQPLVLVTYADPDYTTAVYTRKGELLDGHPFFTALNSREFYYPISAGCIADQTGDKTYPSMVGFSMSDGTFAMVHKNDVFFRFPLSGFVGGVSYTPALSSAEPDTLIIGRIGDETPEIAWFRLLDQPKLNSTSLTHVRSDPFPMAPTILATGDFDGDRSAEQRDLVGVVDVADIPIERREYAQIVLGAFYRGKRIAGLMPLSPNVYTMSLYATDLDDDDVDDIILLSVDEKTYEQQLEVYLMGSRVSAE